MGTNKEKHTNLIVGLIMVGVSALLLLISFGVFNPSGKYIKDFLLGTFGLSFYGLALACFIMGILKMFKFRLSASVVRIFEVVGIYSLFILAFHATSYDYMSMSSNFGEYIAKCYYGADTAGGVLGAIVMYPLMMVNHAFAIVVVALLLFVLIGVTMFGGKISFKSTRTHSVKYSGRRKKNDPETTHVEVESELRNEDADGNPLGDIRKRSRFSREPVEYVPLESEEELSDEDVIVEYKDQFAYSTDTSVDDDTAVTDEDRRIAAENLYGDTSTPAHRDEEVTMTDHEMFIAAVNRIRNNEDSSYIEHLTMDDDDYVEYTGETRDEVVESTVDDGADEDTATRINIDDFSVDDSDTYDVDHISAILDDDDDADVSAPETSEAVDSEDISADDDVQDDALDDEIVADESISYPIDDFSDSLDRDFAVEAIDDDSEYNLPLYSREEQYSVTDSADDETDDSETVDESITDEDSATDEVVEDDAITATGSTAAASRVSKIEDELIEGSNGKKRRRRSDFGGTHQSQYSTEEVGSSGSDVVETPAFINPFATKGKEEAVTQESSAEPVEEEVKPFVSHIGYKYKVPPLSLLNDYVGDVDAENSTILEAQCRLIEDNLENFGIYATIQEVVKGPTFSRIELAMDKGTGKSVKAIVNLAQDIEMWLGCNGHVNILAPIPGKTTIGIEVPNSRKRTVGLKEVFNSQLFNEKKWRIPFALGVDINNEAHVCDIVKMPHLLIAGSTGSGKSVGIAALLNSILYRCSPDEVKLILIDPKKVELSDYEGLPHMLIKKPICESKQVINVLNWLIDEMERRYTTLASVHASKIEEYNEILDAEGSAHMPYIVVVIDEVADLMLELKKNLEDRINKLAAKSRAAGIHLVLATQRPSVDIITGKIKANLPSRIAFATVQPEDSRTILGVIGAEKLLRDGDMLFMNSTSPMLDRIQGAFISKKEVVAVTDFVRDNNPATFDDGIQSFIERTEDDTDDDGGTQTAQTKPGSENTVDTLFVDALDAIIGENRVSISLLQRKLGIGYPRAGKIYDQLTEYGYINGTKVLITRDQFNEMFGNENSQD